MKQDIMYHVAPVTDSQAIAAEGLIPRAPDGGFPEGVYLFPDLANALFFADHFGERGRDEYGADDPGRQVWKVEVTGIDLCLDPALSEGDPFQAEYPVQPLRSFYACSPIAPDRIRAATRSGKEPPCPARPS
jgi:hypothetical protein